MADASTVFVVQGRNGSACNAMFSFLTALGLKPLEWEQAVALTETGTPYTGQVLEAAFAACQAVVVLLTPDDVAYLRAEYADEPSDPETEPMGQARPNVLFEAGMALGLHPDRTILIEFGDLRPFSDVGGRHTVRLSETPAKRHALAERLRTAGCAVDTSGSAWLSAGDFTPPSPPGGGLPLGKRVAASHDRGAHVDGHWYDQGNKLAEVKITNNGSVPILEVEVVVPEGLSGVTIWQDAKVSRLPPGKSFTLRGDNNRRSFGGHGPAQFELAVQGQLEDGSDFKQDVYFDAG